MSQIVKLYQVTNKIDYLYQDSKGFPWMGFRARLGLGRINFDKEKNLICCNCSLRHFSGYISVRVGRTETMCLSCVEVLKRKEQTWPARQETKH